jgi:RNA polymerase sigma factor (sigma-70 family)
MLRLVKGGGHSDKEAALPSQRPADDLSPLVAAVRRGSEAAVRTLLTAVGPAILKVVRRVLGARHADVEDVAAESAFAFLSALTTFRGDCSTVHFACRIAVRTSLKNRRAAAPHQVVAAPGEGDGPSLDDHQSAALSPLQELIAQRRRSVLRALLQTLPEPQAEVLTLHLALGYTVDEIATAIGIPANTVRSRLRLAKSALRGRIATDGALQELLAEEER